jgi:TonB family protein
VLLLPTFHARLLPCSESWATMAPAAQGRHCARCQRVVQDFTQSQNPTADLAAARAAAPDGRVCGRFTRAQVQGPPPLTWRLRWFVVALVLVVAQGLSAREALAQVRQGAKGQAVKQEEKLQEEFIGKAYGPDDAQRPRFEGGGASEIVAYIQQHVKYPGIECVYGRVFASFTIDSTGHVQNPTIVKSLSPSADAEVIRVIKTMDGFTPGTQNGKPVNVTMTVPISFKIE